MKCIKYILILSFFLLVSISCKSASKFEGKFYVPYHPQPAQNSSIKRIAVISDINGGYGSTEYGNQVTKAVNKIISLDPKPDLLIITGDMVAGQYKGLDYRAMWRAFHNVVTIPIIAVTPGNHDASAYKPYQEERAVFVEQWKKYKPTLNYLDQLYYPLYYSFSMGNVLFISLDATKVGPISWDQKRWLQQQLTIHNNYKHKIVFGHLPLYPFTQDREEDILWDAELMRILKDHKVNVFLSGHHHGYYPGMVNGIHMVSQGCLGGGPRKLIGDSNRSKRAITLIDFSGDGYTIEALKENSFTTYIDRQSLPETLNYQGMVVYRDDVYRHQSGGQQPYPQQPYQQWTDPNQNGSGVDGSPNYY